ncbi:hypothetical protein BKA81DRAFT_233122 [Phyllosticta paracitricarpa]
MWAAEVQKEANVFVGSLRGPLVAAVAAAPETRNYLRCRPGWCFPKHERHGLPWRLGVAHSRRLRLSRFEPGPVGKELPARGAWKLHVKDTAEYAKAAYPLRNEESTLRADMDNGKLHFELRQERLFHGLLSTPCHEFCQTKWQLQGSSRPQLCARPGSSHVSLTSVMAFPIRRENAAD